VNWSVIAIPIVDSYIIEYQVAGTTTSWTPVLSSRPPLIILSKWSWQLHSVISFLQLPCPKV